MSRMCQGLSRRIAWEITSAWLLVVLGNSACQVPAPVDPAGEVAVIEQRVDRALERGDLVAAHSEVERAIALLPSAARFALLARLRVAVGDHEGAGSALEQATLAYPGEPDLMMLQGDRLAAAGDALAARRVYSRILALCPNHADSWLRMAALARGVDACMAAERDLAALEPASRSSEMLVVQAQLARCVGQPGRAQELLAAAGRAADFHVERTVTSALLYLMKHRRPNVRAAADLLSHLPGDADLSVAIRVLQASVCLFVGEVGCAEQALLTAGRKDDPLSRDFMLRPEVGLLHARVDVERGLFARGAARLQQLLPRLPSEQQAIARNYRARALLELGLHEEAQQELAHVTTAEPFYGQGQLALARYFERTHNRDAAARVLEQVVEFQPRFVDSYLQLAALRLAQGDVEEGVRVLQRGLRAAPEAVGLWVAFARAQTQADPLRARGSLERALQLDPVEPTALSLLAEQYVALGRDAEAFALYEDALPRAVYSAPLKRALARLYAQRGQRMKRALHLAQAALAAAPDSAAAEATLGYALYRLGHPGAALPHLEAALAADPANVSYQEDLALIHSEEAPTPLLSQTVPAALAVAR